MADNGEPSMDSPSGEPDAHVHAVGDGLGPGFVARPQLGEISRHLDRPGSRILLLGIGGSGKTTLLRHLEGELRHEGRPVLMLNLRGTSDALDLGDRIRQAQSDLEHPGDRLQARRSSVGGLSLSDAVASLESLEGQQGPPVLILDGLDESAAPPRVASGIAELDQALRNWVLVVASRQRERVGAFEEVLLQGFTSSEAAEFLQRNAPLLSQGDVTRLTHLSEGLPLALSLLARLALYQGLDSVAALERGDPAAASPSPSLAEMVEGVIDAAAPDSGRTQVFRTLIEHLALAGGSLPTGNLAQKMGMSQDALMRIVENPRAWSVVQVGKGRVALHVLISDYVVSQQILRGGFRLGSLHFGAEEAERDQMLDRTLVPRHYLPQVIGEGRTLVIGDRGSGKSAIVHQISQHHSSHPGATAGINALTSSGDSLHRVLNSDSVGDADSFRAAWLILCAATAASAVPRTAPRKLRRDATNLRMAFGFEAPPASLARRVAAAVLRPFAGTTLKFAVGPANLEAKLPTRAATPGRRPVAVEDFLAQVDELLFESGSRLLVLVDRVDETHKYDRARQEAVVQGLLLAESKVSQFRSLSLIVFLRTDLYELYDIQEKNKLVSRTIHLEWPEQSWLEVLVNRILVNDAFYRLRPLLRTDSGDVDVDGALEVLFPKVMEGQPIARWLTDSMRNGNGDLSPRLAVLLLHLARRSAGDPDQWIEALPLFTTEVLARAMTGLSELSFSEVVNDFKVAPTFVLNCRAGKLSRFDFSEVEGLFDSTDGKPADQIRLLEKLGFLEREVTGTGSSARVTFRVPRLYTRCWDDG